MDAADADDTAAPLASMTPDNIDKHESDAPFSLPMTWVVTVASLAVVLPILYRLGSASILIVVFGVAFSAVPALRQVVDSILGKTAAGRHRLTSQDATPNLSRSQTLDGLTAARNLVDAEAYVPLDVGDVLQPPLSRLIDLVQRDFIDYWYSSSVALSSDTPFPQHTRSLLNATFNNLVARMKRQDPKEVSIYLFHSASNSLISQVRENKSGHARDAGLDLQEKQNLIRKVRRTSEELMLTLAPRSACMSPLVLSLLIEVLSLQIWSTIQSLNADYINTTIVSSFGQAVTAVKKVQKDAQKAAAEEAINGKAGPASNLGHIVLDQPRQGDVDVPTASVVTDLTSVPLQNAVIPPPLPVRKVPSESLPSAVESTAEPAQTIKLNSPEHTFAASGLPSYGMMASTSVYTPRRKSMDANSASPSTSRPNSVPSSPRGAAARLEDRSIEEALDQGAAKLKAFGKNLFTAGQKFLDAAIPPDEQTAISHARQSSAGGVHSRRGSVQLGSPKAPSIKGKERAIELDEDPAQSGSAGNSSPTTSVRSPSMARDPSRKSIASFSSGLGFLASPPGSRPSSIFGGNAVAAAAPAVPMPAHARLQIAIDILKSKDSERCAHLAKQLERSLFSKDLALLFPAPQDDQLRAVLARQTSSLEVADPSLGELSDAYHTFLERDTSGIGERLLRLWTQLDHFGYMLEMTKPTAAQLYDDSTGLLQKIVNQMEDFAFGDDGDEEKAYVTACEMTMLRLQQNPNKEIFEPLQDWLLRCLQEKYWDGFIRERAGKDGAMPRPAALERVPSASTSKRTLDSIPGATSGSTFDDGDIGMSLHDGEHDVGSKRTSSGSTHLVAKGDQASDGPSAPAQTAATAVAADMPAVPAFTVTLTDLSPPSAYLNNHVKNRKELEFLIAVEVEGSPGYILARKYSEFEKLDAGIRRALPQSGTKAFPRAPLPSTNFQTSENLCRSLEHYLEALLHDDRYAASEPVVLFFAKERTDSKGGPVQPLAFLGRGVNNIGKGVADVTKGIGKGGEFAGKSLATGFNQFTSAVTTLPGLKRTTSSGQSGTADSIAGGNKRVSSSTAALVESEDSARISELPQSTSMTSLPASISEVEETKVEEFDQGTPILDATLVDADQIADKIPPPLPPRSSSPEGYDVSALVAATPATTSLETGAKSDGQPRAEANEELPAVPSGFHYTPRRKATKSTPSSPTSREIALPTEPVPEVAPPVPAPAQATSPDLRGRMSFDELLQQDNLSREQSEETDSLQAPTTGSFRAASPLPASIRLSPMEFNNVISFAMAILEEVYDLVDSTWNLKRGLLKVLETVLRTSYAGYIQAAVQKLVMMAKDEAAYGERIDGLTDSFWPPPERVWWSSLPGAKDQPERTATEKEATRLEARRLLLLQAPEGLKVTLGSAATAEAFTRLHDALQGQGAERLVSGLVLDYLRLLLL